MAPDRERTQGMTLYVLDSDGQPVAEPDFAKWCQLFGNPDRQLALDQISPRVCVSTIFLGIDRSGGSNPPFLWETIVFTDGENTEQQRYRSRKEAEAGHRAIVERLRACQVPT